MRASGGVHPERVVSVLQGGSIHVTLGVPPTDNLASPIHLRRPKIPEHPENTCGQEEKWNLHAEGPWLGVAPETFLQ